jgi:hypothetical protein
MTKEIFDATVYKSPSHMRFNNDKTLVLLKFLSEDDIPFEVFFSFCPKYTADQIKEILKGEEWVILPD